MATGITSTSAPAVASSLDATGTVSISSTRSATAPLGGEGGLRNAPPGRAAPRWNRASGSRPPWTGRGRGGDAYARIVTPTSNGSGWANVGLTLWSARALADTASGSGLVGVSSGSDSNATVDRGALVMGISAFYNSAPAVVSRADGPG